MGFFKGIIEGYSGETILVLGQSSAKLWHENNVKSRRSQKLKIFIQTEIFKKFLRLFFAVSVQNHEDIVESDNIRWK